MVSVTLAFNCTLWSSMPAISFQSTLPCEGSIVVLPSALGLGTVAGVAVGVGAGAGVRVRGWVWVWVRVDG
jgi:hypothetical protein